MRQLTDRYTRGLAIGARLFSVFGAIALVLAVMGMYSVLSYSTAQRTRELAVRAE